MRQRRRGQAHRHKDISRGRHRQTVAETEKQRQRQKDRQKDIGRGRDGQTEADKERQTGREGRTDRHKDIE